MSLTESSLSLIDITVASILTYKATQWLVGTLRPAFLKHGLKGKDMLKPGFKVEPVDPKHPLPGQVDIPESLGLIGAGVYILILTVFLPVWFGLHHYIQDITLSTTTTRSVNQAFPFDAFASFMASLQSILVATFLGFLDDLFDIKWKYKIPIPLIASIPLVVTYIAGGGLTTIYIPRFMSSSLHIPSVIDLGPLYYLYMMMLSTFCTNAINILAGVNGVEVGQALIIALSIAINDLLYLRIDILNPWIRLLGYDVHFYIGAHNTSVIQASRHTFSLQLMVPLVGLCFGLLRWNWYPAKVFVGDTFCYFAGMVFAVVGIIGHFGRTLLLFFIPQIFNFLYSTPQLFKLVPCPRHRLPKYNVETDLLEPSETPLANTRKPIVKILYVLHCVHLLRLRFDDQGVPISCTNLTLLNLLLVWFGPMRESSLCKTMLATQAFCSLIAYAIRYGLFSERP